MKKKRKISEYDLVSRLNGSKIRFMLLFFFPAFLLYLWLFIYPIFESVQASFTNWNGFDLTKEWVGWQNYQNILTNDVFWGALKNDFVIVFWKEILIGGLALLFSFVVTHGHITKVENKIYRFLFYVPNVLSVIVITTVWTFVLNPSIGLLNGLLDVMGLQSIIPENGWLVEYTIPWIIVIASWCGIGTYMVLLIAAINNVPGDLYEASHLDGANQFQQFYHVTVPAIWPQIRYLIVSVFFGTLASNMGLILPLTGGGPDNRSMVMSLFVYQYGMNDYRVGYANAAAVIFMIISMVLSLLFNNTLQKKEDSMQ